MSGLTDLIMRRRSCGEAFGVRYEYDLEWLYVPLRSSAHDSGERERKEGKRKEG